MSSIVQALRAAAGPGAPESGAASFLVKRGTLVVSVEFKTDSDDDVLSMTLSIGYDAVARRVSDSPYRDGRPLLATRPLEIELRREGADDVVAKEGGLSVEWQSGDADWDRGVYVSSPTTDGRVLGAVLGPAVRAAVRELLDVGFGTVGIDVAGRIEATLGASVFAKDGDARAERTLAALERLAAHVPAVESSGERRAPRPFLWTLRFLMVIGGAGWLLNVGWAGLVGMAYELVRHPGTTIELSGWEIVGVVALGILGGVVGAWLFGNLVARMDRGRSDTHRYVGRARLMAFLGFSVITFTVGMLAALALADG